MSQKYFSNFPVIYYGDKIVKNIVLKTTILKDIFLDSSQFYTYQVKDGEKPTTVAYNYYGSVDYVWLVLLSNQITDPYFEWCLSNEELDSYIIKKYGSIETAQSTIIGYREVGSDYIYSPTTYQYVLDGEPVGLTETIYAYEYEIELNEQKRNIKLIDSAYSAQIALELEKSLR